MEYYTIFTHEFYNQLYNAINLKSLIFVEALFTILHNITFVTLWCFYCFCSSL